MSATYYAVRGGFSPALYGPMSEDEARAKCELIAADGSVALLVNEVATCAPEPRRFVWSQAQREVA